jgi:excisionase family DNA binding protein
LPWDQVLIGLPEGLGPSENEAIRGGKRLSQAGIIVAKAPFEHFELKPEIAVARDFEAPLKVGISCAVTIEEQPMSGHRDSENQERLQESNATHDDLPLVLTVDELSRLLRVNRNTVYELFHRGEIPGGQKVGRSIRFSRDTVVQWLRGNCRDSHSDRSQ